MLNDTAYTAALQFGGEPSSPQPVGAGLIHRTCRVQFPDRGDLLLQAINTGVFRQPETLVANYLKIYEQVTVQNGYFLPAPVAAKDGSWLWTAPDGTCWRALDWVPDSFTPGLPENTGQVRQTAACFAAFTVACRGLESAGLTEPLPRFHDLSYRWKQLEEAVAGAESSRLEKAGEHLQALKRRSGLLDIYARFLDQQHFPVRILHHDCKISNILFHQQTGAVICPVDLDTVMPGRFYSDLGDMIRTMACTAGEEEQDLQQVGIDKDAYEALVSGYSDVLGRFLTPSELEHLPYSGAVMIFMQAIRFLADYLNGDTYYRTTYPEQNLFRAANQLHLLKSLEGFLLTTSGIRLYPLTA